MRFEAVVFDLFGTLVSSTPWRKYRPVVDQMAELLGAPPAEFYAKFNRETRLARETGEFDTIEQNLAYVCTVLGIDPGMQAIDEAADLRRQFIASVLTPRPDAISTMRELEHAGLKIGLISDASTEVPGLFQRTEMAEYMSVSVFSSQVGRKKPDPEMYRLACAGLAVEPGTVLYVGDGGSNELSGAVAYGMSALLYHPPGERFGRDEFRPEAKTWQGDRVTSLSAILDIVHA